MDHSLDAELVPSGSFRPLHTINTCQAQNDILPGISEKAPLQNAGANILVGI